MGLSSLDSAVHFFCHKGVADSTLLTYQSTLHKFYSFCTSYSVLSPFPVSEQLLCYFSAYLACQKLSLQTIKTYLAGVRHMQIVLGLPEPRQFSSLPRLKLVQSGIQRTHQQTSTANARVRLPITPAILLKIRSVWDQSANSKDVLMLWAAATMCFFGFFRLGEITLPSVSSFDPSKHLAWGDVSIDSRECPKVMKIHLKRSKTDQAGRGADKFISRADGPLCPVAATLSYIIERGTSPGPFFKYSNGKPLLKWKFVSEVRNALQASGLPYQCFAGHSFRIGAATSAANAGLEDSLIHILGRWNSDAFLLYIKSPKEHLAHYSSIIANLCNDH